MFCFEVFKRAFLTWRCHLQCPSRFSSLVHKHSSISTQDRRIIQWCKMYLKQLEKYIFLLVLFQTGKPMAPFLIEALARAILWEVCLAETLEGAKTMLTLFEIDMSKQIQSSSAAVVAASSDWLRPHRSVQLSTLIQSSSAAVVAASLDRLRPHRSDDDQIIVETCTDPCGLNQSDEAASTAADDDQIMSKQENKVFNSKIGIEFSLKYDMHQVNSSGKITSM